MWRWTADAGMPMREVRELEMEQVGEVVRLRVGSEDRALLTAVLPIERHTTQARQEGADAERERLREAVLALTAHPYPAEPGFFLDREEVLDLLSLPNGSRDTAL